jgi:hypothetical protein
VGVLRGCAGMLPRNEDGIQVLAGLAQSSQTVGFLLRTPWLVKPDKKIRQKVISMNSLQQTNTLYYFLLNAFVKVNNFTNLQPTQMIFDNKF